MRTLDRNGLGNTTGAAPFSAKLPAELADGSRIKEPPTNGATIGDSVDADLARSQAEIESRMGRRLQGAVTIPDVIAMTRAGLSDDVITTHVRASGVAQPLGVNDLIALRDQGVSDVVIKTMQQTPQPGLPVATAVPGNVSRQVIVEHHYDPYCPPPPPMIFHHHRRPRYCGPPPGVSWGFSFHR